MSELSPPKMRPMIRVFTKETFPFGSRYSPGEHRCRCCWRLEIEEYLIGEQAGVARFAEKLAVQFLEQDITVELGVAWGVDVKDDSRVPSPLMIRFSSLPTKGTSR
jgi:hypothetical protein